MQFYIDLHKSKEQLLSRFNAYEVPQQIEGLVGDKDARRGTWNRAITTRLIWGY